MTQTQINPRNCHHKATEQSNFVSRLRIAHINDTHSHFEPSALQLTLELDQKQLTPFVSVGGFARIATRVKALKQDAAQKGDNFLFLHAGDCFQGTLYFSLFKGQANADLLNALQIDAMALGNHELDMGNDPVARFLTQIEFPLLAGNWDVSQEDPNKTHQVAGSDKLYPYQVASKTASWITKQAGDAP
ncbi:MAG: metallophosphoesterase, partial [Vibrio sp.]